MIKIGITGSLASEKRQRVEFYPKNMDHFLALIKQLKNFIRMLDLNI